MFATANPSCGGSTEAETSLTINLSALSVPSDFRFPFPGFLINRFPPCDYRKRPRDLEHIADPHQVTDRTGTITSLLIRLLVDIV